MSKSVVSITSKAQLDNLLQSSRILVADFYADWCGPCKQIAPLYESLAESLSRPGVVTFVKINNDTQKDIASEYSVSALPTFLIFRSGKVIEQVQGADPQKLQSIVQKLANELENLGSGGSSSGANWLGAEVPRGYGDITDQIELRGCELLNADEESGPVKTLFDKSKPSSLDGKSNASPKDWIESGADDQLLLYIPLQSTVKLHTLQITSLPPKDEEDVPTRPEMIHLYVGRTQNLDFDEAEATEPTQAIELTEKDWNENGTANIGLKYVKFQKTSSLVIFVQRGDSNGETVRLDRVKLIGEAGAKREMGKLQKIGDDE